MEFLLLETTILCGCILEMSNDSPLLCATYNKEINIFSNVFCHVTILVTELENILNAYISLEFTA